MGSEMCIRDRQWLGAKPHPRALYWESIPSVGGPVLDFRSECLRTAESLANAHGKNLVLFFSGGLDSEVVLRSFLAIGFPPRVLTIDFGFNENEILQARDLCRELGVPWEKKVFDVDLFWKHDVFTVAEKVGCISPPLCALMAATLEVEGYPVFGYGELDFFSLGTLFLEPRGERWSMARWLQAHRRPGCASFFRHRPELELASLEDPMVQDFQNGSGGIYHRWFSDLKYFFYHRHFGARWRPKQQPYQLNAQWSAREAGLREELRKRHPGHDGHYLIDLDLLRRMKRGELAFSPEWVIDTEDSPLKPLFKRYLRQLAPDSRHSLLWPYPI